VPRAGSEKIAMSDQNDDPLSIANLGRWLGRRRPVAAPAASRPAIERPEQAISSSALVALFAHAGGPLELLHASPPACAACTANWATWANGWKPPTNARTGRPMAARCGN
jgi:hypothetical protein